MKKAIEFLTLDGLVLVGFKMDGSYIAISSYENDQCGIWPAKEVIYENELSRPIFYKSGQIAN